MTIDDPDVVVIDRAKRFDLAKVLIAHDRLVDALMGEFGEAVLMLPRSGGATKLVRWDEEGRTAAGKFWLQLKTRVDASAERLCHVFGAICTQSQLLGSWADLPSSGSEMIPLILEHEPVVRVFGPPIDSDPDAPLFSLPEPEICVQVERVLQEKLPELRLTFSLSPPMKQPVNGLRQSHGIITFPFSVYGDGLGRVRLQMGVAAGERKTKRSLLN